MKIIKIGEKEYKLEYTFAAAEHKETVQAMFNIMSGAYVIKNSPTKENEQSSTTAMLNGVSEMVADIPHIVKTAFYAGLIENHKITEEQSYQLLKQYMIENKISFKKMYEDIRSYMEQDGFFELSGLNEMIEEMNQTAENITRPTKKPQDHKKKQTSTK